MCVCAYMSLHTVDGPNSAPAEMGETLRMLTGINNQPVRSGFRASTVFLHMGVSFLGTGILRPLLADHLET